MHRDRWAGVVLCVFAGAIGTRLLFVPSATLPTTALLLVLAVLAVLFLLGVFLYLGDNAVKAVRRLAFSGRTLRHVRDDTPLPAVPPDLGATTAEAFPAVPRPGPARPVDAE